MQMLMICCESGLDEKVTQILDQLEAPGYTVCRQATGKGGTGPKHNNPIWPGSVSVVHACVPDDLVAETVDRVREARDSYLKRPGCCVIGLAAERLL